MAPTTLPIPPQDELADDLLRGAAEIAEFVFGQPQPPSEDILPSRNLSPTSLSAGRNALRAAVDLASVDISAREPRK